MTRDGWTQTWNGENRLIRAVKGNVKLQFAYDYMGRRVEKKVGGAKIHPPQNSVIFMNPYF